jgi:hypothetical protein
MVLLRGAHSDCYLHLPSCSLRSAPRRRGPGSSPLACMCECVALIPVRSSTCVSVVRDVVCGSG